jgi:hypothetical protein
VQPVRLSQLFGRTPPVYIVGMSHFIRSYDCGFEFCHHTCISLLFRTRLIFIFFHPQYAEFTGFSPVSDLTSLSLACACPFFIIKFESRRHSAHTFTAFVWGPDYAVGTSLLNLNSYTTARVIIVC